MLLGVARVSNVVKELCTKFIWKAKYAITSVFGKLKQTHRSLHLRPLILEMNKKF